MSWEEIKIGSICKIKHGYAFKGEFFSNEGEYILLSPGNFFESGGLKSKGEKEKYYVGDFPSDYILNEEDLLVVMTDLIQNAPILGGCAIVPEDNKFLHNQRLGKITNLDENKIDKKFLYYCLNEENYRGQIRGSATGATVRHTAPERIYNAKVNIPTSLETQKRIAAILSAYDDLIENNLKRIKLLEETAQNIYKEWFVNFRFPNYEHTEFDAESGLPVGWEKDIIGNQLFTIKRKGKLKTDDYGKEGKFPIIDQANGFIAGYTNNEDVVQDSHLPIVVFGDHTRRVKFVNFPFVSGADGTQLMYPKNENLLPAYFYLAIINVDLSNYAYARHFKFIKEQHIIIPDDKILLQFNSKVYPLLEQTIQLFNYNQKLKEARDILLPRLMNRTIEV